MDFDESQDAFNLRHNGWDPREQELPVGLALVLEEEIAAHLFRDLMPVVPLVEDALEFGLGIRHLRLLDTSQVLLEFR